MSTRSWTRDPGQTPSGGAYWPDLKGLDAMSRLIC